MPRVAKAKLQTAPAAVPMTPEGLSAYLADYPAIDVLSRRFVDPNDPGSLPILLKGESPNCCMHSGHQRLVKPGEVHCKARDKETGRRCGKPVRNWHIHTCNTAIEGRWAQMKSKGYIPVLVEDLLDTEDVSGLVRQREDDGKMYVRRGDHGKEITMKIPLVAYNYVKDLQEAQRKARSSSKKAMREDLAEAIGANADLGSERDEVADGVYRGRGIQIESLRQEKTTLGAEAEAE
jgi:hypothetical protein